MQRKVIMVTTKSDHASDELYRLYGTIDARHVRILFFVLLVVLTATGCGGDDGGGGY